MLVRGRGLMVGVVLGAPAAPVVEALRRAGVVAGTAGDRVVRLLPPYVISAGEVERFLGLFDAVLGDEPAGDRPQGEAAGGGRP